MPLLALDLSATSSLSLLARIVPVRINARPPYMGRLKSSANSWCFLFSCHSYWRLGGDWSTPIDPHESGGGDRSLDLGQRSDTRWSLLQVDDGCKKPAATSLYTVDPLDPNHDANMRIEGEAPKQQQPILFPGAKTMGGRRATATSGRFLAVSSRCAPRCQNLVLLLLLPFTPLNAA